MNNSAGSKEIELLEELVAWTKFANRARLIDTLRDNLKDPRHFQAFELSDGENSQVQIAKECGLSQPTISSLWNKWRRLGLVMDRSGRAVHLLKPSDLGLEPPTAAQNSTGNSK